MLNSIFKKISVLIDGEEVIFKGYKDLDSSLDKDEKGNYIGDIRDILYMTLLTDRSFSPKDRLKVDGEDYKVVKVENEIDVVNLDLVPAYD